jgi:hypothetical protein
LVPRDLQFNPPFTSTLAFSAYIPRTFQWFDDAFLDEHAIGVPPFGAQPFEPRGEPVADIFASDISEHATIPKVWLGRLLSQSCRHFLNNMLSVHDTTRRPA